MVSPGSARTTSTPWTPGIPLSCAVSGAAGAAGPGRAVPTRDPGPTLPATWFDADTWSVSTFDFRDAAEPGEVLGVLRGDRHHGHGGDEQREHQAADGAEGGPAGRRRGGGRRSACRGGWSTGPWPCAAAMVSHGPAMNRPTMMSAKLDTNAWICPRIGGRVAVHGPEAELGQAGQQRHHPPGARRLRRRPAGDAERGDVHPAQRQPGRHGGGHGHADRDHEDVRAG